MIHMVCDVLYSNIVECMFIMIHMVCDVLYSNIVECMLL